MPKKKSNHGKPVPPEVPVAYPSPPPPRNTVAMVREHVALYDAKTNLSALVNRAAAGEEIVIMKSGRPLARLLPMDDSRTLRVPGKGRGYWEVADDFDAPLPDELLAAFEGE